MPTILRVNGFRFFFYSEEGNEPIHIHVDFAGKRAKFWVRPDVILASNLGLKASEIRKAKDIIVKYVSLIEEKWNEYDFRRKNI